MTIQIKTGATPAEIAEALQKMHRTKRLDAKKYFGKIQWGKEDPLTFQRRLRNEWE